MEGAKGIYGERAPFVLQNYENRKVLILVPGGCSQSAGGHVTGTKQPTKNLYMVAIPAG